LRCRPESSPELDAWRGTEATVSRAMKLIEAGALDSDDVASLADRLEIGERQLRRLFSRHIGAAPITVAQTRRVLLAKQLIHQTNLPMIQVALASGFGSVRRFNDAFQRMYKRRPSELRRRATVAAAPAEITIFLPYRPPYDWATMVGFLETRAIQGLEVVADNTYSRVIEFGGSVGSIHVSNAPDHSSLRVTVRFPDLDVLPGIISRLRRKFDLGAETNIIASALACDPILAPLVAAKPGVRVPGGWDGFEVAVRAVVGQQITLRGATGLLGRIVTTLGTEIADESGIPGLTHAFPRPECFTAKSLAGLGTTRSRAASLVAIADAMRADAHLFDPRRDLDEAVARLRHLAGVGEWTAQYIAMRALGESDAFLASDIGLQRSVAKSGQRPTAQWLLARAERWRPWRAYATLHLWMADANAAKFQSVKENLNALTA
jgi:AraC family transcriptional regulator, regulatory protein of adaptative response / DNA-3-methyladenine glycosylase II